MNKLFVDKSIVVNAPAALVWQALTENGLTGQWAHFFSSGGPKFHLESNWELGSPVLWKAEDGTVIVKGTVTGLQKNKFLRFTVFDVRMEEGIDVNEEDGITFELTEEQGNTKLHVLQGDFSTITDGEKYRDASAEIWDKVLPKIKELAEGER